MRIFFSFFCLQFTQLKIEHAQAQVKAETAVDLCNELKSQLQKLRQSTVHQSQYEDAAQKAERLSSELTVCYSKIETLASELANAKKEVKEMSSASVSIEMYENALKKLKKKHKQKFNDFFVFYCFAISQ